MTRNKGGMGTRFGTPGSDLNPPNQQHKVEMSEGNEYWVAEESPPILVPEEYEEEESAALIYDEVGLMSDEHDISDELLQIAVAQGIEHAELFRLTRADVPLRKRRSQRRMHSLPDDRKSEAPALMRASADVSRR